MAPAKSKNAVGLGNSLMNDRFGKGKGQDMRRAPKGVVRTAQDGRTYITTPKQESAAAKMRSVTEQPALDEFLSTAELAGTDFTAEKLNNVRIIHSDQKNPHLLSAAEERATVKKHNEKRSRLKVPRRPPWNERMSRDQLDERERESFLEWRRSLAELQETDELLLTPFERNIEVWRQLWRVIERSDLVVQIVDARNSLLFRCEDLEHYVKEVDQKKNNLLLVNKADLMTQNQRITWADCFTEHGINFRFFSAHLARDSNLEEDGDEASDEDSESEPEVVDESKLTEVAANLDMQDKEEEKEQWVDEETIDTAHPAGSYEEPADPTRIITTAELESLFLEHSPSSEQDESGESQDEDDKQPRKTENRKTVVGLVGYPNVGKSSTINALLGHKKVSVSATPGKTKHFQTIHLSDSTILCDCPGLVFPNFATTKAELVVNGVLPIDQLREHTAPAALVAHRIPRAFIEAVYGLKIQVRPLEEGGTGVPSGEEVLRAYAKARGFATTGMGIPDEKRAARIVLKDYVNGKLLFVHPPPRQPEIDGQEFNRRLYDPEHLPQKIRAAEAVEDEELLQQNEQSKPSANGVALNNDLSSIHASIDEGGVSLMDHSHTGPLPNVQGDKSRELDTRFFDAATRRPAGGGVRLDRSQTPDQPPDNAGHTVSSNPFQTQGRSHKDISGRKLKNVVALERGVDPSELKDPSGKKHFKGNKRKKGDKVRGAE
ncbi:MAG: hypothetical protein M1831_006042 [Alyxoria varia]|nr:MAG: hypothetical protein M1831_006042 [Alyxoria varia]